MGRIEKPAAEKAVALFENLTLDNVYAPDSTEVTADKVYTPGGVDAILGKITAEVRKTVIDVSTKAGRDAAKSLAYKVARSKTFLDDMGKTLVADWKKQSAKVDAERKTIRERLEALQAEVKKPADDWEQAETDRVAGHVTLMTEIESLTRFDGEPSLAQISRSLTALESMPPRDWQEFAEQAGVVRKLAHSKLAEMKAAAEKREADAAELEALRAEKAERDRKDAEERAERERQELEDYKARKAIEEAEAQAEAEKRRQAGAEIEKQRAAEAAVEAERKRVADQEAAEQAAARKREQNKRHRNKVIAATVEALVGCGITAEQAGDVVLAIVDGKIPNVAISF